ncbi:MAG: hypothetical protein P1V97_29475 [Planctomycetota bacterium]|nr:hypothetical protein [Planctomycetota bacterium]
MTRCRSNGAKKWMAVAACAFLLIACENTRKRKRPSKKIGPRSKRQAPKKAPVPVYRPPVQRMTSGVVEVVTPSFIVVRGQRLPLAGAGVARDLEVQDKVLLTLRRGVVIAIQIFPKNPAQRSLLPPKPPKVGDLVSIDQVIGLVLGVEDLKVTMKVRDGRRYIGQTTLKLSAKSSLRIIKAAQKTPPKTLVLGDEPVAKSIPKSGLLSEVLFVVEGKAVDKKEFGLTLIAATKTDKEYAVTVLLSNRGARTLISYQLSLDFRSFGKNYDFGGLRISKSGEKLSPGQRRRFSIRGEPLIGTPKKIRVMISQLEFE